MTPRKVLEVAISYKRICEERGISPVRMNTHSHKELMQEEVLQHTLYLVSNIPELVFQGKMEKAMRHLGFAQAFLRISGLKNLEELTNDNRPQ